VEKPPHPLRGAGGFFSFPESAQGNTPPSPSNVSEKTLMVNTPKENKEIIFLDSFSEKCNNNGVGGIWSPVSTPQQLFKQLSSED
jgi:hypothetical protein